MISHPYCKSRLEQGKIVRNNSLQEIRCCISQCKDYIGFCFDSCYEKYGKNGMSPNSIEKKRCYEDCSELIGDCEIGCLTIPSKGLDIVRECMTANKCGEYPLFDKNCLQEKRDEIVSCCEKKCSSDSSYDCESRNCDGFYRYLVDESISPLYEEKKRYVNFLEEKQDDKKQIDNSVIVISLISMVIVIVLIGLIIMMKK